MKNASEIYRLAAELVEGKNGTFACIAISTAASTINETAYKNTYDDEYVEYLESVFRPPNSGGAWYTSNIHGESDDEFRFKTKLGGLGRSLMLLFMAEIAKDEL